MSDPATIQQLVADRLSSTPLCLEPVGGGSINNCYRISFKNKTLFCKATPATEFPQLFRKEKTGLEFIAEQNIIRTPAVVGCFEEGDHQVLLLEWIECGERTEAFWKTFGEGLAAFHRVTNDGFGFAENNYMGSVPQLNDPHPTWADFFARQRLDVMVKKCFDEKLLSKGHRRAFERVEQKLPGFFGEENPSLLHGDLWSGNFLCDKNGKPVLIDPAVYYGHRSMDLAMTTLFGGFRGPFYEAYDHHFPFPKNYKEQWAVCNLYPLLIHLFLFGTSYLPQIERTLGQFA